MSIATDLLAQLEIDTPHSIPKEYIEKLDKQQELLKQSVDEDVRILRNMLAPHKKFIVDITYFPLDDMDSMLDEDHGRILERMKQQTVYSDDLEASLQVLAKKTLPLSWLKKLLKMLQSRLNTKQAFSLNFLLADIEKGK
jgi:hypothetical protein